MDAYRQNIAKRDILEMSALPADATIAKFIGKRYEWVDLMNILPTVETATSIGANSVPNLPKGTLVRIQMQDAGYTYMRVLSLAPQLLNLVAQTGTLPLRVAITGLDAYLDASTYDSPLLFPVSIDQENFISNGAMTMTLTNDSGYYCRTDNRVHYFGTATFVTSGSAATDIYIPLVGGSLRTEISGLSVVVPAIINLVAEYVVATMGVRDYRDYIRFQRLPSSNWVIGRNNTITWNLSYLVQR